MSAPHTEGPWRAAYNEEDGYTIVGPDHPANGIVGTVNPHRTPGPGRPSDAEANARLIAASPALLDALQALTHRYVTLVESGDAGHWDAEAEPVVIAARAAIARACGGGRP